MKYITQCAPGIFNLEQKFHGLSCFCGFHVCKRVQNQLKKHLSLGFQNSNSKKAKFSIMKFACQGQIQGAQFDKEVFFCLINQNSFLDLA